jgi:hypothetical protein
LGKFVYVTGAVDLDDRLLAHIRVVTFAKFRRRESFAFTYHYDASQGSGHTVVWMHPAIPVEFQIYTRVTVNPDWVHALTLLADTPAGLYLAPEPPATEEPASDTGMSAPPLPLRSAVRNPFSPIGSR